MEQRRFTRPGETSCSRTANNTHTLNEEKKGNSANQLVSRYECDALKEGTWHCRHVTL